MLQARGLETFYGHSQALFGVDLEIAAGEVLALLGRNGMGKTTTIRSLMRLTPPRRGEIRFMDKDISRTAPFRIARLGMGLVPEGRRIFARLSVEENLLAVQTRNGWPLARIYQLFPRLEERAQQSARTLSGGEQQMLAIARALATGPKLLILDEATEGLAPLIREEIWQALRLLKQEEGLSFLIVDKNVNDLLPLAERCLVLEKGQVAWNGESSAFMADQALQQRYLGV
ncbi:branched-chain amino acid transport system ATP-binding protein [Modicisalibacter muralis]|uniref:Branched-chain amino acid transport system ATP-binding protein n=1 Tax=Modicisalibacter muralis TaxID=119000 RepID=A0A1G9GWZ3_9GAMM|nr:ABC transporter ATP-binding protein [Halomonas muralis]SDL04773.1 branched-chain amino acid transport system ATP-binding protein [Halomonas muralis]